MFLSFKKKLRFFEVDSFIEKFMVQICTCKFIIEIVVQSLK